MSGCRIGTTTALRAAKERKEAAGPVAATTLLLRFSGQLQRFEGARFGCDPRQFERFQRRFPEHDALYSSASRSGSLQSDRFVIDRNRATLRGLAALLPLTLLRLAAFCPALESVRAGWCSPPLPADADATMDDIFRSAMEGSMRCDAIRLAVDGCQRLRRLELSGRSVSDAMLTQVLTGRAAFF